VVAAVVLIAPQYGASRADGGIGTLALRASLSLLLLASGCATSRGIGRPSESGSGAATATLRDESGAAPRVESPPHGDDSAAASGGGTAPGRAEAGVETAAVRPPEIAPPVVPPAPAEDDGPLTAKIDRDTPPRRAAALRLTEQGRAHLAASEPARAIDVLERAIAIDARSPYAYYFLAHAHAEARHPDLARSFVARAEQLFAGNPYWLARAHALHGRLAEDAGRGEEARAEYTRALAAWPPNADAATGLARLDGAGQGAR